MTTQLTSLTKEEELVKKLNALSNILHTTPRTGDRGDSPENEEVVSTLILFTDTAKRLFTFNPEAAKKVVLQLDGRAQPRRDSLVRHELFLLRQLFGLTTSEEPLCELFTGKKTLREKTSFLKDRQVMFTPLFMSTDPEEPKFLAEEDRSNTAWIKTLAEEYVNINQLQINTEGVQIHETPDYSEYKNLLQSYIGTLLQENNEACLAVAGVAKTTSNNPHTKANVATAELFNMALSNATGEETKKVIFRYCAHALLNGQKTVHQEMSKQLPKVIKGFKDTGRFLSIIRKTESKAPARRDGLIKQFQRLTPEQN